MAVMSRASHAARESVPWQTELTGETIETPNNIVSPKMKSWLLIPSTTF
jgi:hypothetical protein